MKNPERKETATDMEIAMRLITHIEKPCEDQDRNNLRDFYIREAKRFLDTFQNPDAKQLLEDAIQKYSE